MTVVATTVVTGTIYTHFRAVFCQEKAGEIASRRDGGRNHRQYSAGGAALRDFQSAIAFSSTLSKAQLQIYNAEGEMIICSLEMGEGFSHRGQQPVHDRPGLAYGAKVLSSGEEVVDHNRAEGESTEYLSVGVRWVVDERVDAWWC